MGVSAAAEPLEEAALPQGGEGRPEDATDAREGHFTVIHRTQQVTSKSREVKGQ